MTIERFCRPAVCDTNSGTPTKTGHAQLWNPSGSGYKAILEQIHVWSPSGFNIGGHGSQIGILSGASFSESRGLPIIDGAPRQYSACHARIENKQTVADIGMWLWYPGPSAIITIPFEVGQGTGLIVRAINANSPLSVSFQWREEVY